MITSSYFYLSISFLGFLGIAYQYGFKVFIAILDSYIEGIKTELEETLTRKNISFRTLEEEMNRYKNIHKEIASIQENVNRKIKILYENFEVQISKETSLQEQKLQFMMKQAQQERVFQIYDQIVDQIVYEICKWVEENLSENTQELSHLQSIHLLSIFRNPNSG